MAKQKRAGRKSKGAIQMSKKEVGSNTPPANYAQAYTGTDLRDFLEAGKVVIGMGTYYKIYKSNSDMRAGIKKISNKVGSKNFYLVDANDEIIDNPLFLKAVKKVFTDPERGQKTFASWKREAIKHYYVAGELYVLPITSGIGELEYFQILDPRTMTKVHDKEGRITKFRQTLSAGNVRDYDPEVIGFYKLENDTTNPVNGMGLIHSVIWDVLTDNKASQRNYYFFENDRVPRAVMKLNDTYDYDDEGTKNAVRVIQDGLKGEQNSNKTILSNLIDEIQVIEMSNKDMEFIQQRRLTTEKVASLLGLSKYHLWYTEGINYATAVQFSRDAIEDTILPLQDEFSFIMDDLLDRFALNAEGISVVLETDDGVDEYKQHADQRADAKDGILTINEVRAKRGEDPLDEADLPAEDPADDPDPDEGGDE